jgi:hypothetical protein
MWLRPGPLRAAAIESLCLAGDGCGWASRDKIRWLHWRGGALGRWAGAWVVGDRSSNSQIVIDPVSLSRGWEVTDPGAETSCFAANEQPFFDFRVAERNRDYGCECL